MKPKHFFTAGVLILTVAGLSSCRSSKEVPYLDKYAPEEMSLLPTKLTDETQISVIGDRYNSTPSNLTASLAAGSRTKELYWQTSPRLAVSPDGFDIAYLSNINGAANIMVKSTQAGGSSTQRTFRNASSVFWGNDGRLYFNDTSGNQSYIGSVDSDKGSLIRQLTSNNSDWHPVLTKDGKMLYFTRYESTGPYIWSKNLETGELTNCTRGFSPVPVGDENYKILCVRNSPKNNSEIWLLDLKNGDETLLLTDPDKGFSSPAISPNGEWVLVVGNSLSSINNKQNTDLYAVKIDGTQLTQITYHPANDCSPVWSKDGRYIYFISSRANKDEKFAIWRISNPLNR